MAYFLDPLVYLLWIMNSIKLSLPRIMTEIKFTKSIIMKFKMQGYHPDYPGHLYSCFWFPPAVDFPHGNVKDNMRLDQVKGIKTRDWNPFQAFSPPHLALCCPMERARSPPRPSHSMTSLLPFPQSSRYLGGGLDICSRELDWEMSPKGSDCDGESTHVKEAPYCRSQSLILVGLWEWQLWKRPGNNIPPLLLLHIKK